MSKLFSFILTLLISNNLSSHHMVVYVYDEASRVQIDVEVIEFRFINPHPFLIVKHAKTNEKFTIEMDNKWELEDIGISKKTFEPGHMLVVTVDKNRHKNDSYYLRALIHPELGFRYEHNKRQLYYD